MKIKSPIMLILYSHFLMMIASVGHAAGLTSQAYIAVDVEVREITLEGMAERVNLLSSGQSNSQLEAILDQSNRRDINKAYRDNGTTAAAHTVYGTQHADEINEWLNANPDWQRHYDSLTTQFESLSRQLEALREGH